MRYVHSAGPRSENQVVVSAKGNKENWYIDSEILKCDGPGWLIMIRFRTMLQQYAPTTKHSSPIETPCVDMVVEVLWGGTFTLVTKVFF